MTIRAMQILRNRKKVRSIQLQKNRELRLFRSGNVEAAVAFQMKNISDPKCRNCVNDNGIFKKCIVVKNCFRKTCASCHYNNEKIHCSLHVKSSKYESVFLFEKFVNDRKIAKKAKKAEKKTVAKTAKTANRRSDDTIPDSRKRKNIDFYDESEPPRKVRKNVIDLNAFDEDYSDFENVFQNKNTKKFVILRRISKNSFGKTEFSAKRLYRISEHFEKLADLFDVFAKKIEMSKILTITNEE